MSVALVEKPSPEFIQRQLEEDVYYGCTPDIASLRYSGVQFVFLWDDLAKPSELTAKAGVHIGRDIRIHCTQAMTKHLCLPVINDNYNKSNFKYYVPNSNSFMNHMEDSLRKRLSGAPSHLLGRVYRIGLKGIVELDQYYNNDHHFIRTKVKILKVQPNNTADVEIDAWMYTNYVASVFKYDPHSAKYTEQKGLSLSKAPVVCRNGKSVYSLLP